MDTHETLRQQRDAKIYIDAEGVVYPAELETILDARPEHFKKNEIRVVRSQLWYWLRIQHCHANAPRPDKTAAAQLIAAAGGVNQALQFIANHLENYGAGCYTRLIWMMLFSDSENLDAAAHERSQAEGIFR